MRYFSTFSGVGGFELGIKYADRPNIRYGITILPEDSTNIEKREDRFTCVGLSEIDKYASAVLKYHFPNTTNYGDITKINWSAVPDFDLLVGGSPCQDFSVAGKRAGITGSRSSLAWEYIRGLHEKKPSYFIWENVKGVLSSNNGWDFANLLTAFSEAGYSLWWQVLNAKDFGVPQNRERVFVVGTRNGGSREILFERGTESKNPKQIIGGSMGQRVYAEEGIGVALKANGGGQGAKSMLVARAVITPDRIEKRQNGRRMKEDGEPAFTLNAQDRHGIYNGSRIRRLTLTECERLMSWADDWTKYGDFNGEIKEISDSQRYKMCGNGVVSKVVEEIIKEHLLCSTPS